MIAACVGLEQPPLSAKDVSSSSTKGLHMGRGILLWLLGVPLPVILLLAMCSHR
jgi:hypothetical protein